MAGPSVHLSVEGPDSIEKNLNAVARALEPEQMMLLNTEIVKGLEEYEKSSWGRGINDLPQTRDRWPAGSTLVNTGALRESMTASDSPGAVRVITPIGFEFGTSLTYARFVNDGTSRQAPKPFLKINTPVRVMIRQVIMKKVGRIPDSRYSSGFRDE